MLQLIAGYLFLLIFRPYEYWPILGTFHIERIYMIFLIIYFFITNENFKENHINKYIYFFILSLLLSSVFALDVKLGFFTTYDYFKYFVFYYIVVNSIKNESDLQSLVKIFLE